MVYTSRRCISAHWSWASERLCTQPAGVSAVRGATTPTKCSPETLCLRILRGRVKPSACPTWMVAGCQRQVWALRSSRRATAPWAPSFDHLISIIRPRRPSSWATRSAVARDAVPQRMSDLARDDTSEIVENVTVSSSSADPRGPARVGQSLESFHDDAKMYWGIGSWHAVLKQYEEALTAFDRAIELDPGVSDFYYSRGSVYADLGMNQEALADFNHSIQLDPNRAATYNDRGV